MAQHSGITRIHRAAGVILPIHPVSPDLIPHTAEAEVTLHLPEEVMAEDSPQDHIGQEVHPTAEVLHTDLFPEVAVEDHFHQVHRDHPVHQAVLHPEEEEEDS